MPTQIVVLDGYTLTGACRHTPAGNGSAEPKVDTRLNWRELEALGSVTVYDRSTAEQAVDRARSARIVLTNKTPLPAKSIRQLPRLKYIGVLATGVDVVDLEAASEQQIVVTAVPGYCTDAVAQHVFALLLELTNRTSLHDRAVHTGDWTRCCDFSFTVRPITELAGKTLGIVGFGAIGRRVAQIGSALGMRVVVTSRSPQATGGQEPIPVRTLPLDQLAAVADVLTLHCPLTDRTRHLINAQLIDKMKPTCLVINTARGPLIDESALAGALRGQRIAGAALDVLNSEPPPADNPLLTAPNCVITPHVAWASEQAKRRLMTRAAENVKAYLAGTPINVVTDRSPPSPQQPPGALFP